MISILKSYVQTNIASCVLGRPKCFRRSKTTCWNLFPPKSENQNYLFCINVYREMTRIQLYLLSLQTNQSDMTGQSINRIRIALAERNKTNRWLAKQMGKSEITISRWVQNKTQPSLEQLLQVAQILSVSPKDLINEVKSESFPYLKIRKISWPQWKKLYIRIKIREMMVQSGFQQWLAIMKNIMVSNYPFQDGAML